MGTQMNPPGPGPRSDGNRLEEGLARQFSEVPRSLQAAPDLEQTLRGIVTGAVQNVTGADFAGITLVTRTGKLSTPAASDELVETIDRVQYEVRQGPCLTSAWDRLTVRSDDLRSEHRWPDFAHRAADLGVLSMLSLQLYVRDEDMGALNLYSRAAGAFSPNDEITGLLFATHAAIALVGAQHETHLSSALTGRDVIGQAKGILMERHQIDAHAAFAVLLRISQSSNRKLRDIAEELATTRSVPLTASLTAPE